MKVSFGAKLNCPVKKIIRETDPEPLKKALAKNIMLLKTVFENNGIQRYAGNDEYTFTRGKGEKIINFYFNVKEESGKKSKYHIYSGFRNSILGADIFYEMLMFHLCQKYNVEVPFRFESFLDLFCNFVKTQKEIAASGKNCIKPLMPLQ